MLRKLTATIALLAAFSAHATELTDGGVENSTWTIATQHSYETNAANVRNGSQSLKTISDGNTNTSFHPVITMTPGTEYCLNAFVKSENMVAGAAGETPILGVQHRNNGGKVDNHAGGATDGYRWAPFEADGTYDWTDQGMLQCGQLVGGANQLRIFARSWFASPVGQTAGTMYWDDFEVTLRSFPDRGALLTSHEAEAQTVVDGTVKSDELDFSGTGYVEIDAADFTGEISWVATQTGNLIYSPRYTREGSKVTFKLLVDDVQASTIANATPTGRKFIYASADLKAVVTAGQTIRLQVTRKGGELSQPLIDRIDVYTDLNPAVVVEPEPPTPEDDDLFKVNAVLLMCGLVSYVQCPPVLTGSVSAITASGGTFNPVSTQSIGSADPLNAVFYRVIGRTDPLPTAQSLRTTNPKNCGTSCSFTGLAAGGDFDVVATHFKDYRYSAVLRVPFTTSGATTTLPQLCDANTLAAEQVAGLATEIDSVWRANSRVDFPASPIAELTAAQTLEVTNNGGYIPVEMTDIDMTGGTILTGAQNHANLMKWLRRAEQNYLILDLGSGGTALVDGQVWVNRVNSYGCVSSSRHDTVGLLIGDPENHPTIKLVDDPSDARFNNASNPIPFVIMTSTSGDPDAVPACNLGGNVNKTVTINDWTGKIAPANAFSQFIRHVNIDTGSGANEKKRGTFALSASTAQFSHVMDVDITVDRAYGCLGRGPGRGGYYGIGSCTATNGDSKWGFNDRMAIEQNLSSQGTANNIRDWTFNGTWTEGVMTSAGRIGFAGLGVTVNGHDLNVAPVYRSESGTSGGRSQFGSATFVDLVVNAGGNSATAATPFPIILNDRSNGRNISVRSLWATGLGSGKPLITSGSETIAYDPSNPHVVRYAFSTKDTLDNSPTSLRGNKLEYSSVPATNIVNAVDVGNATIIEMDNEAVIADIGKHWSLRFKGRDFLYYRDPEVANFSLHGCITNRGSKNITSEVQTYLDNQYAAGTRKFLFAYGNHWIDTLNVPKDALVSGAASPVAQLISVNPAAAGLVDDDYFITTDNAVDGQCGLQDVSIVLSAQASDVSLSYVNFGCGRGSLHSINGRHYPAGKNSAAVKRDNVMWRINPTGGGFMAVADTQRQDRFTTDSIPLLIENSGCAPFNGIINNEHMDSEIYTVVRNGCNVIMGPFKHETAETPLGIFDSDNIWMVEANGIGASAHATQAIGVMRVADTPNYELLNSNPYTFADYTRATNPFDPPNFVETINGNITISELLSTAGPMTYPIIRRGNAVLDDVRLK